MDGGQGDNVIRPPKFGKDLRIQVLNAFSTKKKKKKWEGDTKYEGQLQSNYRTN